MDNNSILETIRERHSVRAFSPKVVSPELLHTILQTASFAPSGGNTQPWKVYVVGGQKKQKITTAVSNVFNEIHQDPKKAEQFQEAFPYYPAKWFSPYLDRRRANGWGLYHLLGIQKHEREKMHQQQLRNFQFFDAPIGLFFTVDKALGDGAKIDTALFIQNITLTAKALGLDTCIQAVWNPYHSIILPLLGVENELLICGMSLGYADTTAKVNQLRNPRVPVEEFTCWFMD